MMSYDLDVFWFIKKDLKKEIIFLQKIKTAAPKPIFNPQNHIFSGFST